MTVNAEAQMQQKPRPRLAGQVRNEVIMFAVIALVVILAPLVFHQHPSWWAAALLGYYLVWRAFSIRRQHRGTPPGRSS